MGPAADARAGMVLAPGSLLFKANPGVGKFPTPACPAWQLGAGSIPAQGFESVTIVMDTSSLLHLLSSLLVSGEALVRSLTCDNLYLYSSGLNSHTPSAEKISAFPSSLIEGTNFDPCRYLRF
ncbi:hypothetical protein DSO57_1014493 [Entomophthora muscae]|uniref:Uncharacterized protein n=1 Tax=Entomophthora muscae TaxID=34485 RepID=A0ACC2SIH5_9FUNG|nr:hypothetical protein DSO57_1014493 [Entomophthora muscae]